MSLSLLKRYEIFKEMFELSNFYILGYLEKSLFLFTSVPKLLGPIKVLTFYLHFI